MSLIEIKELKKNFTMGEETIKAIDNVSFNIDKGEFVAIIGPSGSGKSTLMNILGLLDEPDNGTYMLDGENVANFQDNRKSLIRNQKIGFVFQNFNLLTKYNCIENIQVPLNYAGMHPKESEKLAKEYLEKVGLRGRENHLPSQLSGGQQQRVAIARALVNKPEIILADEPTGALDSKTSIDILNLLKELNSEGQTIILITHDMKIAQNAKRIIKILDGKIDQSKE